MRDDRLAQFGVEAPGREGLIVVNDPNSRPRLPGSVTGLALALGMLAIGALQGGVAMVMDPNEPLGMTLDVLSDSPVDSFFLPGLFLLGMAVASIVTLVGLVFGGDWRWARRVETSLGARWPWPAALAIGVVLLAFEVLELVIIPFHPILHPLLIGLALVIIGLASTPTARRYLEPRSGPRPTPGFGTSNGQLSSPDTSPKTASTR